VARSAIPIAVYLLQSAQTHILRVAISVPALFTGSLLGIVAFRNINEVGFRRTILVLLLVSGASLALA